MVIERTGSCAYCNERAPWPVGQELPAHPECEKKEREAMDNSEVNCGGIVPSVVMKETVRQRVKKTVFLNPTLIEQQQITPEGVEKIMTLHIRKLMIIDAMEACSPMTDGAKLRELADQVTKIEFELQEAWRFPRNIDYHKFWELPHCSCPKMDNNDNWGTPYHVYSEKCILHADEG